MAHPPVGASFPEGDAPEPSEPSVDPTGLHLSADFADQLPGLVVVAGAVGIAYLVNEAVSQISTLIVAIVLGVALGNFGESADRFRPGFSFAARTLLRAGVVLLGLRLSLTTIADLGAPTLGLVIGTVVVTFMGTQWLGGRLGLSKDLSLLVATGFSICGASAIAAMRESTDADEDEVALSIGLVTLAGTLAMFAVPVLAPLFGLSDTQFGTWAGASVHDVAQVVAAASAGGSAVLTVAVVVKLTRVVMLAPLVAIVSVRRAHGTQDRTGAGTPLMPAFVVGFLALMLLRSSDVVGDSTIDLAATVSGVLMTAALVGLGAGVRVSRLRQLGPTPLLLGLLAWLLVAGVSLAGTLLIV